MNLVVYSLILYMSVECVRSAPVSSAVMNMAEPIDHTNPLFDKNSYRAFYLFMYNF